MDSGGGGWKYARGRCDREVLEGEATKMRFLRSSARFLVQVAACAAWIGLYNSAAYPFFYPPGTAATDPRALTRYEWGLLLSTVAVAFLVTWLFAKLLPSPRPAKTEAQTHILPSALQTAVAFAFIFMLISVFVGQGLIGFTPWGDARYLVRATAVEMAFGALLGLALYWRAWWVRAHEPPQVWFSTEGQFEAFRNAVASSSWWRKIVGRFPIADGAAYASSLPWMKTPLVLVARGELVITDAAINFSPVQGRSWNKRRYHNVVDALSFQIALSDIISIAPEEIGTSSPTTDKILSDLIASYWLPWTRIVTSKPAPLDEFFLAVGGRNRNAMQTYRELSLGLRNNLMKAISARRASANP